METDAALPVCVVVMIAMIATRAACLRFISLSSTVALLSLSLPHVPETKSQLSSGSVNLLKLITLAASGPENSLQLAFTGTEALMRIQ